MQCHGIKHYKLKNPNAKNFKITAKLLLLEMAQSYNKRRTEFLGSTGDLKYVLRQQEDVLGTQMHMWNIFLWLW